MTRLFLTLCLALWALAGHAASDEQGIAQIKLMRGDVRVVRAGNEKPAAPGDWLRQSDVLVTGPDGRVGITFIDNTRFSAGPGTRVELETFEFNPTTHEGDFVTRLSKGTLAVTSGQLAKYSATQMKIRTPSSVLGVNGTRFLVKVAE